MQANKGWNLQYGGRVKLEPKNSPKGRTKTMANRAVIKFGGADLATGEKIRKAAKMVAESGYKEIVVVVSAMAGVTDNLTKLISEIGIADAQDYADIVSMGERTSARILCSALRSLGVESEYFDPSQENWPIITDSNFKDATPNMEKTCERVRLFVEPLLGKKVVVVCGFLGRDEEGHITTLGRGGSDTTAMVLGNCLKAEEIVLVKETEGVMSADPKIVPEAKPLKKLDIHEMFALSHGGAKIIKAEALKFKLPDQKLRVVSFFNGISSGGTEISGVFNSSSCEITDKKGLVAVSMICSIEPSNVSKIIASFGNRPIYGISTGKVSLTVFTSSEEPNKLISELHRSELCKALSLRTNVGLIEVTHPSFIDSPGWVAKVSGALASKNINIIEVTSSKATISIFIDDKLVEDALKVVRDIV
ncbi:aspartate kinase [Candidatus Bathyarchaeota archaeon]|nr:aspartate kinase [Candidatus Bathyarchaeota archaeon]